MTFHIEFLRPKFSDPQTGLTLEAPDGHFRTYHPRNSNWLKNSPLRFEKIICANTLTPTPTSNVDVGAYIEKIGEAFAKAIPKKSPGVGKKAILVALELSVEGTGDGFKLDFSPGPEGLDPPALMKAVMGISPPNVLEYTVLKFIFSVWG